jgi:hypothetical protein
MCKRALHGSICRDGFQRIPAPGRAGSLFESSHNCRATRQKSGKRDWTKLDCPVEFGASDNLHRDQSFCTDRAEQYYASSTAQEKTATGSL